MFLFSLLYIFLLSASHAQPWQSAPRKIEPRPCSGLLLTASIREVISTRYKEKDLIKMLRAYQRRGRKLAESCTAYSPEDYLSSQGANPEALRGHCGGMVWFVQQRFGGKAVLKQYVSLKDSSLQVWHMHNSEIPIIRDGMPKTISFDLTKAQFSSENDDLKPIGSNEIVYQGENYVHKPGKHVHDTDYRWDQDFDNPPRTELELFRVRLEMNEKINLDL